MNRAVFASVLLLIFSFPAFCEDSGKATYDDIDFPQWARDLRRTEIITLGSLPFVTIWTVFGYTYYEYGEFRNPLGGNDSFTTEDQKTVAALSLGICAGLGIFDLVFTLVRRAISQGSGGGDRAISVSVENVSENGMGDGERERIRRECLIEGVVESAVF